MKRPCFVAVGCRPHIFVTFILFSHLIIGTFGTEKKDTKQLHMAAAAGAPPPLPSHAPADAKHAAAAAPHVPADAKHSAPATAADQKHPSAAAPPHNQPQHTNGGAAHVPPETKHPATPAVKITDEANNIYSVCVERDVLPAPDNAPKDKLKAIAAKCDECGTAKCKDKCGGKEVTDACRTCIAKNCPPAK